MKKVLFLATALVALASCSDDIVNDGNNLTSEAEGKAITFGSYTGAVTRADHTGSDAAGLLGNNFVVEGFKWNDNDTKTTVFDHYNVNWVTGTANTTTSNTNDWEYVGQAKHDHATIAAQTIKYWDYAKSQYDFIAYSVGTATANYTDTYDATKVQISKIDPSKMNGTNDGGTVQTDVANITKGAYSLKGKASELAKCYIADLVTAYNADNQYQNTVTIKFRSLAAKVRIGLYETVPGYSVKDVVFYTDGSTAATDSKAHLYTTGSDVFNSEGEYIVYYPTTGYANKGAEDYNKAHLKFTAVTSGTSTDLNFDALDGTNTYVKREVAETTDEDSKLYIGRSSNAATFAGDNTKNHYTVVIPNETGVALNLKVNYTLISTDGSNEVINVTGATAQVPAQFATWKSGYAYTYLFKISDNTNGVTNPEAGPAGLYPITFDAVVMNDEVDGIQETITTVSTPSITTYTKGEMVTAKNEYLTGSNIYAFIDDNTALTVGTNANLYTVTLEAGAAQTINEASVANAIKNGGASSPYEVTDANGKKMTVTAASGLTAVTSIASTDSPTGAAITINGAKFTPAAPTFSAVNVTDFEDGTTDVSAYYTRSGDAEPYVYTKCAAGAKYATGTDYYNKTVTTAGTYVFEYINGANKYYKIIKVVDKY